MLPRYITDRRGSDKARSSGLIANANELRLASGADEIARRARLPNTSACDRPVLKMVPKYL